MRPYFKNSRLLVKKYTNSCLFNYSQTFCMKKAAALLLETTASISEIMEELHFTNTTHFYKCFKEHYHMTPKQYRISMKIKLVP
nr:helix-turn-helix domain-containing protein [uncultured Agathobacter sp.]